MSRLKKMKHEKIKNIIIGLTLSLIIGITGCLGSYAYFTEQATIENGLTISLGELDTNIKKDLSIKLKSTNNGYQSDKEIFYIENKGTLSQKVEIKYSENELNNDYISKLNSKLNYKIEIIKLDEGGNKLEDSIKINKTLDKLYSTQSELIGDLEVGNMFKCEVTVTAPKDIPVYEDTKIKFKLEVNAEQL